MEELTAGTNSLTEILKRDFARIVLEVGCASRNSTDGKVSFKARTDDLIILADPRMTGIDYGENGINRPEAGTVYPFKEKVAELPAGFYEKVNFVLITAPDPQEDRAAGSDSAAKMVFDSDPFLMPGGKLVVIFERYSERKTMIKQALEKIVSYYSYADSDFKIKGLQIETEEELSETLQKLSGMEYYPNSEFPLNNATVLILTRKR